MLYWHCVVNKLAYRLDGERCYVKECILTAKEAAELNLKGMVDTSNYRYCVCWDGYCEVVKRQLIGDNRRIANKWERVKINVNWGD